MLTAAPIYYFGIDGDEFAGRVTRFVGRNGSVVRGCHDLAALLTFTRLSQANDFHIQNSGVFEGSILRLQCYRAKRPE